MMDAHHAQQRIVNLLPSKCFQLNEMYIQFKMSNPIAATTTDFDGSNKSNTIERQMKTRK